MREISATTCGRLVVPNNHMGQQKDYVLAATAIALVYG